MVIFSLILMPKLSCNSGMTHVSSSASDVNSAAVAQEVEGSSTNQKISGLIPTSSSPHVDVFLGKILCPKLLLMAALTVCEC